VAVNALGHRKTVHLAHVLGARKHHFGRDRPLAQDALAPVDVLQEMVERLHALAQPGLQPPPGPRRDHAGDHVEGKHLLDALLVGCEFRYQVTAPSPAIVQVRPRTDAAHRLVSETWATEPVLPLDEYDDVYGNGVKRLLMPEGELQIRYDAVCEVPDALDPDA